MQVGALGQMEMKTESFKRFLPVDMPELTTKYRVGQEIGHGQFGTIHIVVDNETGKKYACKSMLKRKLRHCSAIVDVEREIQVCY